MPIIYATTIRNRLYRYTTNKFPYTVETNFCFFSFFFEKTIQEATTFYTTNEILDQRAGFHEPISRTYKILTLTHWYDFPVCILIAAVENTSKPLRRSFRRNRFEIWASVELGSQTAKPLSSSNWPTIKADAVVWKFENEYFQSRKILFSIFKHSKSIISKEKKMITR